MNNFRFADLGSISHGTLRPADLVYQFALELEWQIQRNSNEYFDLPEHFSERNRLCSLHGEAMDCAGTLADDSDADPEEIESAEGKVDDLIEELTDALQEFAPPYCYFGAHEGDGSDFGFWPDFSAIDDAVHDGEIEKIDAGDPWPTNTDECLSITDHGNVSLYANINGEWSEVWAIV